eukprot:10749357-Alexandrium_andersonii.AAC.1
MCGGWGRPGSSEGGHCRVIVAWLCAGRARPTRSGARRWTRAWGKTTVLTIVGTCGKTSQARVQAPTLQKRRVGRAQGIQYQAGHPEHKAQSSELCHIVRGPRDGNFRLAHHHVARDR